MDDTAEDFVARARVSRQVWAPELQGKTAIVTGAGRLRSIGRPIALELARQGVNVVLTSTGRDPSHYTPDEKEVGWRDIESVAEEVRGAGGGALPLVSDVTDPAQVTAMVEASVQRFGRIDFLVNNAGAHAGDDRRLLVDVPLADWEHVLKTNLTGAFLTAQAAARQMVKQREGGAILNISSIASRVAAPNYGAYSASKAGLNALSHTLAMELAEHKIRVNAVLPGIIETTRLDRVGRGEAWREMIRRLVPLNTAGTGMEIAYMCVFLCSDMGAWITGQDIAVDGGYTWR